MQMRENKIVCTNLSPQKDVFEHVKTQCNRRLGNYPRGNILTIDVIKQDGKVQVPWILVANSARQAKKGLIKSIVKRYLLELLLFTVRENHLASASGVTSGRTERPCGTEKT